MRKLSFIILLLITNLALAQDNLSELISAGENSIKEKNYKAAVSSYKHALEISNTDTLALNGIIRALTLMGDYREAQKYAEGAIKTYPDNAEFIFRKGIIHNLNGDHEKAVEEFNSALNLKSTQNLKIRILLNKASAEFKLENFTGALDDYNQVIELDPRNANAYNYRGLVNYRLNYFIDAVNDYNNSIDLEPNVASTYYNRGMSYLKLNEKYKACVDFHKACQLKYVNACKMIVIECSNQ